MATLIDIFQHISDYKFGIYLESGFLNLISTGECTEGAYFPATLHYTSDIANYVTSTNTPLQGTVDVAKIENESIIAIHDTEVATASLIDTIDVPNTVVVTDITEVTTYALTTDYTITQTGITALSSGSILDLQNILIDYDVKNDEAPFTGQAIVDGSESLAVGCSTKLATITDPCSNEYTAGGYCAADIVTKKDTQDKVSSSMFSGKLRLFVQAIYGSTRSDYRKKNNFDLEIGDAGDATYPPFTLFRGFTNNSWLYTTANYDYFLCTFTGTAIQFRAIDFSTVGEQFRDILKDHSRNTEFDFVTRVEAYILSTGQINGTIHSTVNIVGDTINGSPLDYGWHVTWDGHEATVVCFYDDPLDDQYLSDQHQLTVGETFNGTDYTFTVNNTRLISDSPWWPQTNGLQVFYYDETAQSMFPVPYPNVIFGGFDGAFDSPIYNYYSLDTSTGSSQLQTVNIFMNKSFLPNEAVDTSLTRRYSPSSFVYVSNITYTNGAAQGDKGFRLSSGATFTGIDKSIDASTISKVDILTTPTLSVSGGLVFGVNGNHPCSEHATATPAAYASSIGTPLGAFHPTEPWKAVARYYHYFSKRTTSQRFNEAESSNLFFQIILGMNDSIVIGKNTSSSSGGGNDSFGDNIEKGFGAKIFYTDIIQENALNPPVRELIAEMPGPLYVIFEFAEQGGTPSSNSVPASGPDESFSIDASLADGSFTTEATGATLGNNEYFSPQVSSPQTNTIDTGRRSILSDKFKVDHDAFTKDGGFIHDSSVGWS